MEGTLFRGVFGNTAMDIPPNLGEFLKGFQKDPSYPIQGQIGESLKVEAMWSAFMIHFASMRELLSKDKKNEEVPKKMFLQSKNSFFLQLSMTKNSEKKFSIIRP